MRRQCCNEKATLLMAYEQATRAYSEALGELTRAIGAAAYSECQLLKRKVAVARDGSEAARELLERHLKEHEC